MHPIHYSFQFETFINNMVILTFLALTIIFLPYIAALITSLIDFAPSWVKPRFREHLVERWLGFLGGDFIESYEEMFECATPRTESYRSERMDGE